jgi:hypothetical protein
VPENIKCIEDFSRIKTNKKRIKNTTSSFKTTRNKYDGLKRM